MIRPRPSAVTLASEVVASETHGDEGHRLTHVLSRKLHAGFGRLIGSHGFDVLLARALRLAREAGAGSALDRVTVGPDGALDGFPESPGDLDRSAVLLLSYLFELLIRFVGDDLARRVVHDIWPDSTLAAAPPET